jgi:hypothetical protein
LNAVLPCKGAGFLVQFADYQCLILGLSPDMKKGMKRKQPKEADLLSVKFVFLRGVRVYQ